MKPTTQGSDWLEKALRPEAQLFDNPGKMKDNAIVPNDSESSFDNISQPKSDHKLSRTKSAIKGNVDPIKEWDDYEIKNLPKATQPVSSKLANDVELPQNY